MKYQDIPWHEANCQNTDVDSWYPTTVNPKALEFLARICAVCEIENQCLAWAVQQGERGFWGGQYFPERMEKDDVEDIEGVHTAGDGDCVPEVWAETEGEMRAPDW